MGMKIICFLLFAVKSSCVREEHVVILFKIQTLCSGGANSNHKVSCDTVLLEYHSDATEGTKHCGA